MKYAIKSNNGMFYNVHNPEWVSDAKDAWQMDKQKAEDEAYQLNSSSRFGDHASFWAVPVNA